MPSVFSHAIVALALKSVFPEPMVPRRLLIWGAVCSVVPDFDVIGFQLEIPYGAMLGHRGLSHSIAFALVLASGILFCEFSRRVPPAKPGWVWLYLFLATVSHGLLDAMTDGGMGVALFAPFNNERYYFPWTPIAVSPIGREFFSSSGLFVLKNEMLWLWLPSAVFVVVALLIRRIVPVMSRVSEKVS